jgi:hypothetical protein
MTKLKLLGAAALVLSLAAPAMAQDAVQRPGHDGARMNNNARMNNRVGQHRHMARNDSRMGYRHDNRMAYRTGNPDWNNGWNGRHDSGFWPGDVAADVVGGAAATADAAVGTAGAIATAPFRNDDSYAYYNNGYYHDGYSNNGLDGRNTGFWPGDVAADVVGGAAVTADAAVGTAGAIATAPFSNNYNNGYNNGWYHQSYAERNGFVCQPGTWFKGEDGRRHICQ